MKERKVHTVEYAISSSRLYRNDRNQCKAKYVETMTVVKLLLAPDGVM